MLIETKVINTRAVNLYARGGTLGVGILVESGEMGITPLRRVRTHRNQDKAGRFRWYNDYRAPDRGTVAVRLHATTRTPAVGRTVRPKRTICGTLRWWHQLQRENVNRPARTQLD